MTTATVNAIPQRTITITITPISTAPKRDGDKVSYDVSYSYWSPVTGLTYTNTQTCDLKIDRETYTLFVLDFQSSLAGWTIVDTKPNGDSGTLPYVNGPHKQSISILDPYKTKTDSYQFFINYANTVTGETFSEDPQETNVPPR